MTKQIAIAFVFSAVVLALCILPNPARAEQPASPKAVELDQQLATVQQAIKDAQKQLEKASVELTRKRHEVAYSDPELKKLQTEIAALEVQLQDRRRQMDALLSQNKDLKEIEAGRSAAFKKLSDLKETERLIQNEMKAAPLSAGHE